jgi:hypothetical protein
MKGFVDAPTTDDVARGSAWRTGAGRRESWFWWYAGMVSLEGRDDARISATLGSVGREVGGEVSRGWP